MAYIVTDDTSKEVLLATGESVGADFGMKDAFLTLNTGEKIQSPQPLKQSLIELRKLNKSLSRKVKGSGNWWRAVRALARLYCKVADQRRDWHWKLATDLCRRFDTIVTETLNLNGMKRLWDAKSLTLPLDSSLRFWNSSVSNIIVSCVKSDSGQLHQSLVQIVDITTKI